MATLQEQHIAIKFRGGIETKMDSKAVPSAKLLALENGVFTKAISIKKRNGYAAYSKLIENPTGGAQEEIADARRLGVRDENELLKFTRDRCYSHQTGTDQWSDIGTVYSAHGSDKPAVHTGTEAALPDHATLNGVTLVAWEDNRGGVYYTVVDAVSGRVFLEATEANGDGERPRCVAVGTNLHLYFAVPNTNTIHVIVVDPEHPSLLTSSQQLTDELNDNPVYDVCPTTRTNSPSLMVWMVKSDTTFRVAYIDASGVMGSPSTGHPSAETFALSSPLLDNTPIAIAYQYVDGDDGDLIAVANMTTRSGQTGTLYKLSGGNITTSIGTTTGDVLFGYVTVSSAVVRCAIAISDGRMTAIFEDTNGTDPSKHFVVVCVAEADDVISVGTTYEQRGVRLVSRAFVIDDEVFAYFIHDTVFFNTYLALRVSSPITDSDGHTRLVCVDRRLAGSAAGSAPIDGGGLPSLTDPPSDGGHVTSVHVNGYVATTCLGYRVRATSEDNNRFTETGLRLLTLDFDNVDTHQTAQLGHGLYLAGGCPQHYDGRSWCEAGFHMGPEVMSGVASDDGGGMGTVLGATHLYVAWYEYTDTQGEVHRGPTSIGLSVALDGGEEVQDDTVTLDLPTCRVTMKERVRICVARSLNGDASQLFRVTSLDPTTEGDPNGYVANDVSVDTVSFVDQMSDADLRKQEPLYTNGGILSNDPTSLGNVVATGKNRLFFSDSSEPNNLRYSQELADGYGVECAPELVLKTDPFGGPIRAIHVMDEFVVVFKESAIYAFNGAGPTANGDITNGAWSNVDKVTSDVGCNNPSSIVDTPKGLMFQTPKGIYRLNRDRSIEYVGAAVEAYNGQTIARATVMPDRSQVVFLTADGTTLLFDFLFEQWSTFTNHLGRDSVVVDGTYHYLRLDDRVFAETIDQYSDAGVRIRLRLETAWIHIWEHLQGLQRFWKLLVLGTWGSPHQLGIQYRTDFDESGWGDPVWLDATGEPKGSTGWITGDNANVIGEDPITGDAYGDGEYGDGVYGGEGPDVYHWRLGLHCAGKSIQFRFEDFEKVDYAGATFELTEMLITGGVLKADDRPVRAARSS